MPGHVGPDFDSDLIRIALDVFSVVSRFFEIFCNNNRRKLL
jgi:hypothetical protein